jgi:hypothetical protein
MIIFPTKAQSTPHYLMKPQYISFVTVDPLSHTDYWRLASKRALPSLPGLASAVLWTVERLPGWHSTAFSDGH